MSHKKQYAPIFFSILIIGVGIVGLFAAILREQKGHKQTPPQAAGQPDETFADMGNAHIEDKDAAHEAYHSIPPTSGAHIGSSIAPWGVHNEQIPDELQVHNLEDGGVIIHYDPVRVDGDTIEKLNVLTNRYTGQVILEPYTNPPLPAPIVLTAWTRRLALSQLDEKRIETFIQAYRGIDHHVPGE